MISAETIQAFNSRMTININNIKSMKPSELDQVKSWGSSAENLLKNKDLAQFIHEYKFQVADELASLRDYTAESNEKRIALSNHLSGIDGFVVLLQQAVYYKNKVVSSQNPTDKT
jgi:hypothetical protein